MKLLSSAHIRYKIKDTFIVLKFVIGVHVKCYLDIIYQSVVPLLMKSFLDEFYKIMPKKTCNYVDFTVLVSAKVPKISSGFFSLISSFTFW